MEEGEEKKLAQMELNHQKEIAELKRLKTDYLQKKIDLEKLYSKLIQRMKVKLLMNRLYL